METKVNAPRKIFEVIIYDKPYDVYDIEGKEKDEGNGEPKTWWMYYGERLPEGLIPPIDSENWVHWHSSIQRHCWEIKFKQKNTTKEKWGDTHFRSHTSVEMWCNGKLFYSFGTTGSDRGMSFAMAKVQYQNTETDRAILEKSLKIGNRIKTKKITTRKRILLIGVTRFQINTSTGLENNNYAHRTF